MGPLAYILAAGDGALTIEGVLLNLGLPGVVILALGLYARSQIKAGDERYQRLEARYNQNIDMINTQWVPALTRSSVLLGEATKYLSDLKAREEKLAAIEEARRLIESEQNRRGL